MADDIKFWLDIFEKIKNETEDKKMDSLDDFHIEQMLLKHEAWKRTLRDDAKIEFSDEVWSYFSKQVVGSLIQNKIEISSLETEEQKIKKIAEMIDGVAKEILVDKKYPFIEVNGKKYIGYKFFDDKNIIIDSQLFSKKQMNESKRLTEELKSKFDVEGTRGGIYDLECRKETLDFCQVAGMGAIKQFQAKAPFFIRRKELIEDAHIYKFKDKFISLLVEHNKNDIGFRPMPQNNMWIECSLPFGDTLVTGLHLKKIKVNNEGSFAYQIYDEDIYPAGFDEDGISVFYSGISKGATFYSYFALSTINTEFEKRKKEAKYYCPFCNSPMLRLDGENYYCDMHSCVRVYQKGSFTVYNMKNKKMNTSLSAWRMDDVWKIDEQIKLFVCNLLDFINNKEVVISVSDTPEEIRHKNVKRIRRGQKSLFPVNIINVCGHLEKKINLWRTQSRGSYTVARTETTVDGHYRRFWMKNKWRKIYSWIAKCNNAGEIDTRLKELKRVDDEGKNLPDYCQYRWDEYYKVIYIWIEPFKKFEGKGVGKQHIHMIKVDKKEKGNTDAIDIGLLESDEDGEI